MNESEEYFQNLNDDMLVVNKRHSPVRISPQKARAQRDAWTCFRDRTRTQNENLQTTRRESKWNKQRGGYLEMNRFIDQNMQQEYEKQLELASEEYVLDPADLEAVQEEDSQEVPLEFG
ncbi:Schizosaccharomyces specific protein Dhm2 [Schizosaccharomyces osmophilus]|uniref:Schizosaccharomyces specific protein Dhm2 n=1 Tax=Schizosaccharomyces osmophilus TaxID=2545709 RepID=A0AAE9WCI4_9SCHI|nr:Schizosaccharomyces specific protein Dhm2 [Schizosaccharomyces osmophilus]WBW73826.1 Schizosaccharomyces specific protein Dhm2 [Schizosaccharomyces osmophilus]